MENIFELENHLLSAKDWKERYVEMPLKCQEVVDADPFKSSGPTGIGYLEGKGWFILCSGQGPFIAWQEWEKET